MGRPKRLYPLGKYRLRTPIVRQFNDAFQSVTARREIKKKLRAILWVKYQIKDNVVFERAYQYIEMYY